MRRVLRECQEGVSRGAHKLPELKRSFPRCPRGGGNDMENDVIRVCFRLGPTLTPPGKIRSAPPILQALLSSSYFELEASVPFP